MDKTIAITKDTPQNEIHTAAKLGRAFIMPFSLNSFVWIILDGKATRTLVMDISVNAVQLNGRWYTWDELDSMGGIYESEFEALSHAGV